MQARYPFFCADLRHFRKMKSAYLLSAHSSFSKEIAWVLRTKASNYDSFSWRAWSSASSGPWFPWISLKSSALDSVLYENSTVAVKWHSYENAVWSSFMSPSLTISRWNIIVVRRVLCSISNPQIWSLNAQSPLGDFPFIFPALSSRSWRRLFKKLSSPVLLFMKLNALDTEDKVNSQLFCRTCWLGIVLRLSS